jgi:hypothetical protein
MLAILRRVSPWVDVAEAERALAGGGDPKDVRAALLTVAAACRGERTHEGEALRRVALWAMEGLV